METLAERDSKRSKTGYSEQFRRNVLAEALQSTPRQGLWLDASEMTIEAVIETILKSW